MTAPSRRAARLFTGAVFPEEIARGLIAFAERHQLMSNVWVPKKLVGKLKSGVTLVPNAILCDLLLIPGCGATDLVAIGSDRVLVNADHTTDPLFFERYREDILAGACASLPLTLTGVPERDSRSAGFASVARSRGFTSPYWVKQRDGSGRWANAEETLYLGRYNPTDCIFYEPCTLTNQSFPPDVAQLMRRKASRFDYLSRTWVTAREGELQGTRLNAERMKDGPPIFTAHFSGSGRVQAAEYFCADQFEDPAVFPTAREIDLAATGVLIGSEKVRGYPVLFSLSLETSPTTRHRRMAEEVAKRSAPLVFSVFHGGAESKLPPELQEAFRRISLLRAFTRPWFLHHTKEVARHLKLRPQEQGIVFTAPAAHDILFGAAKKRSFFNIEQFDESSVLEEMVTRTPKHFLTQMPLCGFPLVECARAQCAKRELSQMWIPDGALKYLGGVWKLSPDALRVPQTPLSYGSFQTMYNISDMSVPTEAVEWWSTYFPHDIHKKSYLGHTKMLLSLRAWEQQYTSPLWVTQELVVRLGATQKSRVRRKNFLSGDPFAKPPSVVLGNETYINIEEIRNVDLFMRNVFDDRDRGRS